MRLRRSTLGEGRVIKSVGKGKYEVVSEKTGKRLSKPLSKSGAKKRLAEIEYFKHKKG